MHSAPLRHTVADMDPRLVYMKKEANHVVVLGLHFTILCPERWSE